MKNTILAFAFLAFGAFSGAATAEIRETQFPSPLPKTIIVAGADYRSSTCLKPWITPNPSEYAGRYVSRTITDGNALLELSLNTRTSDGKPRWHVDGKLETTVVVGIPHIVTFRNAELQEPKQPTFDVLDRLTPGLFVIFIDPESADKNPKHAVVIGHNVFVREKELTRSR